MTTTRLRIYEEELNRLFNGKEPDYDHKLDEVLKIERAWGSHKDRKSTRLNSSHRL